MKTILSFLFEPWWEYRKIQMNLGRDVDGDEEGRQHGPGAARTTTRHGGADWTRSRRRAAAGPGRQRGARRRGPKEGEVEAARGQLAGRARWRRGRGAGRGRASGRPPGTRRRCGGGRLRDAQRHRRTRAGGDVDLKFRRRDVNRRREEGEFVNLGAVSAGWTYQPALTCPL